MNNEIGATRDITGSLRAEIVGNADDINGPLFAINWFDTRLAFVYHFYNLLAAQRVFRIGGKLLFKGKCKQTIAGNPEMARQFLLIVRYPSGTRFLDLLADRIFRLMSVFRIMAVKRFSFVFHKRRQIHETPEAGQSFDSHDCYAVLHFKTPPDGSVEDQFSKLDNIAAAHQAEIFFAGSRAGQVVLTKISTGKQDPMSFITDTTVLMKTENPQTMAALFAAAEMKDFLDATPEHFASYVKRTM